MQIIKNRKSVTLSNKIPKGKYDLSRSEKNFIYLCISQIEKDDKAFKIYKFHISDLENRELCQKNYKQVKDFVERLASRGIKIEDEKRLLVSNWFSSIEYIKDTGTIEACFDPKLKPYFLELKDEFTKANLKTLLSFNSKYSSRLYLLLKGAYEREKQYRKTVKVTYPLEFFFDNFYLPDSYKKVYSKFKNIFLLKAISEVNELTTLTVSFKEDKTGRKITSISFSIEDNKEEELNFNSLIKSLENQNASNYMGYIPDNLSNRAKDILLNDCLFTPKDLENIFLKHSIDKIEDISQEIFDNYEKIKNKKAFFRSKL